jgi:hypothetical protein
LTDTQASGHVYAAGPGQEVHFRLRATDRVSNAGGWVQGDTRTARLLQETCEKDIMTCTRPQQIVELDDE